MKRALSEQENTSIVPVTIGGMPIPGHFEAEHFLFVGKTGSGKSLGISNILDTIRLRNRRCLIADAGGEFLSRFYRGNVDKVLNLFDQRTEHWSPFRDIREDYDCSLIANAAIPEGVGAAQEWANYARVFLSSCLLAQHRAGETSVRLLQDAILTLDRAVLQQMLAGTPAAIFCSQENERMLGSIRAVCASHLEAWNYLSDKGCFSVREWVREAQHSSWLFLTYRSDQRALLRGLVGAILDLAIVEALSLPTLPQGEDRDLWFILDEVATLGKVSSLGDGLAMLRKYGCKCVLGLQSIAQFRATYGIHEAQALMSNIGTKVILQLGDAETAAYFSKEIGEQDVLIRQTSASVVKVRMSATPGSSTTGTTDVLRTQPAVLPAELMRQDSKALVGYLKMPTDVFKIEIEKRERPRIAEAYCEISKLTE